MNFAFEYSYGDPQTVQVLAKRSLGRVELKYRINNGRTHSAETKEWRGGEKYKPAAVHYHELRGVVRGADPGDTVKVWFEGDEGTRTTVRVLHLPAGVRHRPQGARRRGRGLHGRLARQPGGAARTT